MVMLSGTWHESERSHTHTHTNQVRWWRTGHS